MKKFLSIIACYLVLVLGITCAVNAMYVKVCNIERDPDIIRFRKIPENIQICNVGSSHGAEGFCYENQNAKTGFNFGWSSQSLSYDYRMLLQYQKHLGDGCIVFIPISYFSIYGIPEVEQSDFESKNARYYHVLRPNLIMDYSVENHSKELLSEYLPSLMDPLKMMKGLLNALNQKPSEVATSNIAEIDMVEHGKKRAQFHIFDYVSDSEGKRAVNQENIEGLKAMIALCREKGWIPVLITTPFTAEYKEEIKVRDPGFLPEFYSLLNQIIQDEDVPYYDYSEDPRFYHDHALFRDSDHLNQDGAKLLVDILMEEVVPVVNTRKAIF